MGNCVSISLNERKLRDKYMIKPLRRKQSKKCMRLLLYSPINVTWLQGKRHQLEVKADFIPQTFPSSTSLQGYSIWTLTCEQVPEVVWLECFDLTPTGRLSVSDFITSDKSILCAWRWREPTYFDALKNKRWQCWYYIFLSFPPHKGNVPSSTIWELFVT